MDTIADTEKFIKSNDLVCREEKGFFLVFNFNDGIIHRLNNTAKTILDKCDGRHTIAQIAEDLSREYPSIKRDEILTDIRESVRELHKRKLITRAS